MVGNGNGWNGRSRAILRCWAKTSGESFGFQIRPLVDFSGGRIRTRFGDGCNRGCCWIMSLVGGRNPM